LPEFPKSVRLLRPTDFRQVYDGGAKYTCPLFAAFYLRTEDAVPVRFGFTCPRALGKAVLRNRIKRRLRECVRLRIDRFPQGFRIVFNPRRATLEAPGVDIDTHVERFLRKLNALCATYSPPS
jgi:ribonuclease P protein component